MKTILTTTLLLLAASCRSQPIPPPTIPPSVPNWNTGVPTLPPGTVIDFQKWFTMCPYCLTTNVLRCYGTNINGGSVIPAGSTYVTNLGAAPLPGATCTTNVQVSSGLTNVNVSCVFLSGASKQEYSLNFWCPVCGAFFTSPGPARIVPTVSSVPAVPMPKSAGRRLDHVLPGVFIDDPNVEERAAAVTYVYNWSTNQDGTVTGSLQAVLPQASAPGGVQGRRVPGPPMPPNLYR